MENLTVNIFGLAGVKIDGTIGALTGQGCIGLKDYTLGVDGDVSLLKFSANVHIYLSDSEYNPKLSVEGYLGGLAGGERLFTPLYHKEACGLGYSITLVSERSK